MRRTNNVDVSVRDGTTLLADLFQPDSDGAFPALVSFSPYPRQIQDVGAPLGFIEAGASDFFVPRGYVHLIVNARGTGGSGGVCSLLDQQEREDLYDLVEWVGGPALVRRQCRHARRQLLRHGAARRRRR